MASGSVPTVNSPPLGGQQSLCARFVDALLIDGASISLFGLKGNQSTICATDDIASRAETLQFELGEGPHWEALGSGRTVLCPDLHSDSHRVWPMFSESARALGIAAVFAFPMKLGAATIGVVDLLSLVPRRLDAKEVALAELMANRIVPVAMTLARLSADHHEGQEAATIPALRREVHQATGMIQSQLNVSATDAFARLRAYAFTTGRPVDEVARDVVSRDLDFSTFPD